MNILNFSTKLEIARKYDLGLSKLKSVKDLPYCTGYINGVTLSRHEGHKYLVASMVDNENIEEIIRYIDHPDFQFLTTISNPINGDNNSIESTVFITQLLEYNALVTVDWKSIILNQRNRDIKPYYAYTPIREWFASLSKYDRQIAEIYFNKKILQIALKIRKIAVGKDKYITRVEYVPVYIPSYVQLLSRLINEYHTKFKIKLTDDVKHFLESKAISLSCNIQFQNGKISESLYASKALDSSASLLNLLGYPLNYINPKIEEDNFFTKVECIYEKNWDNFQNNMKQLYNLSWKDNVIVGKDEKINIWNPIVDLYYDNRMEGQTLNKQYILHK